MKDWTKIHTLENFDDKTSTYLFSQINNFKIGQIKTSSFQWKICDKKKLNVSSNFLWIRTYTRYHSIPLSRKCNQFFSLLLLLLLLRLFFGWMRWSFEYLVRYSRKKSKLNLESKRSKEEGLKQMNNIVTNKQKGRTDLHFIILIKWTI